MKKILCVLLIIMCLILAGCGYTTPATQINENPTMYAVSQGGYNIGNFVLLVNADGSPMIWEG